MADYTYLVTDIKNTSEDDSTEFLAQIPKLVNKAENRLMRELDDVGLNSFSSVAVSTSNPFVSLFRPVLVLCGILVFRLLVPR